MSHTDYVTRIATSSVSPDAPHEPFKVAMGAAERVRAKLAALKVKMILAR